MKRFLSYFCIITAILSFVASCNQSNNTPPPSKEVSTEAIDSLALQLHQLDSLYNSGSLIHIDREIESDSIDCVVFTSASTVKGFVESTGLLDYSKVTAACIGKQTKAAADDYGMQTYMSEKATIDSLVELVVKIKNR